jgi:hypothetical protein
VFIGLRRKKKKFVVNAVQVEMQRHHFHTLHHVVKAVNVIVTYRAKHRIVNTDMV